ncbi:MAG: ABC transporter substrate-binding protein [Desulfurococcaceae archaeon]
MPQRAYLLAVVLLIVGIVAGYGIGSVTAPRVTETVTVPGPGAATVTTTVVQTVTLPAPGVGLSGEVRIGALLPLSGVLSSFGAEYKAILEYVEGEINSYLAGLGRPWRIKFVVEDTGTDPKTHLDKLMALAGAGIKIFIGGASSAELSEALSFCNANNILIISPSSTSPALALVDMGLRYTPNDLYQGKAIAKIMWERGMRWIIPMWRGDTWGDGLAKASVDEFTAICKASGETCGVIEGIRYDPAAKEFSAEISLLASKVTDATGRYGKDKVGVLLISFEEAAAIFAAAKAYPILSEVMWQGSDGTANVAVLLDPGVADIVIKTRFYNTMASPGISPRAEIVRNVIRAKLGRDPMGYTYFVYDIAWTVALTLDAVGTYDAIAVKNALPYIHQNYLGASGLVKLDENGDRVLASYDIWFVVEEAGKYAWKVIGIYDGATGRVIWYTSP